MALTLGANITDRISYGTGMAAYTSCSFALWFYPTTLTTFKQIFIHHLNRPGIRIDNTNADELFVRWQSDVVNLTYITNNADLTTNKWWYLAVSFNPSAGVGEVVNLLLGDLTTMATERTYGTATDGLALNSNAGGELIVGNNTDWDGAFQGRLSHGWLWPGVVLTHAEFRAQQRQKAPVRSGASIVTEFGEFGTGTQHNRSGYGNYGTVTGATYARAPELDTIFMPKYQLWTPQAIAAAAARQRLYQQQQAVNRAASY